MRRQFNMKLEPALMKVIDKHIDGIRFRSRTQVIEVALVEFFEREEKEKQVSDISKALRACYKVQQKRRHKI